MLVKREWTSQISAVSLEALTQPENILKPASRALQLQIKKVLGGTAVALGMMVVVTL